MVCQPLRVVGNSPRDLLLALRDLLVLMGLCALGDLTVTSAEQEQVLQLLIQEIDRMKNAMEFVFQVLLTMPEFATRYQDTVQKIQAQAGQKRPPIIVSSR